MNHNAHICAMYERDARILAAEANAACTVIALRNLEKIAAIEKVAAEKRNYTIKELRRMLNV